MNTAAKSLVGAALRAVVVLAVTASVSAAAQFESNQVRLSFYDADGGPVAPQLNGSVRADVAADGSRTTYSIRIKAPQRLLETCGSGMLQLDYMAVPTYTDRRTGAAVHPRTNLIVSVLRDATGAGAERVVVPFMLDAGGRFETQDVLRPVACFTPNPDWTVSCGIKWSTEARVDCD